MVGWHHHLKRHGLGQILGDGKGQGSLAAVHGVSESDMTEQLNKNNKKKVVLFLVF